MSGQARRSAKRDAEYGLGFVTSNDGTRIGYREYGSGPAMVLVNGAIGTTQSYHELASDLATDFTVLVPERRGRPLSPRDYHPDHVIAREVEDVESVLNHSGAHFLFGLSSGAVIALEAARVLPSVHKLALYEAPLWVPPEQMRLDLVSRFDREIEAGQTAAAMVTALTISGTASPILTVLPRPLLELAVAGILRLDDRRKTREYPPLRTLVPTMQFDFKDVGSMQNRFETFRSVLSGVLLLTSTGSAKYFLTSAVALEQVLPRSQRIELRGLGHGGPWNTDRLGKPKTVATVLRAFFKA
ncbi:alpha/beta fold hydrolase [Deinococcus koreensis]|uniref:Alpha/beta hydrolase n=1 Tax=Deinococcus koreensis TaxID=2054903 RepID=A0A2K3UW56_9DEIO|nr:alpha/beta hydrolase [Deinococcus koreensis]PNY80779.1 alpha/beta hydrolase [Deinococcus koreensis]